ncbi:MAG: hypothetical protein K2H35_05380 [Muribaculaceae bacterium]|nr:hypothetical protein [Muribaculaceae bacterium]MDE6558981.1 hypothetical protein [Muribaculaceae bacterium]
MLTGNQDIDISDGQSARRRIVRVTLSAIPGAKRRRKGGGAVLNPQNGISGLLLHKVNPAACAMKI